LGSCSGIIILIVLQKGHYNPKKVIIKQTCRGGISSARLYGGLQHKKNPKSYLEKHPINVIIELPATMIIKGAE